MLVIHVFQVLGFVRSLKTWLWGQQVQKVQRNEAFSGAAWTRAHLVQVWALNAGEASDASPKSVASIDRCLSRRF